MTKTIFQKTKINSFLNKKYWKNFKINHLFGVIVNKYTKNSQVISSSVPSPSSSPMTSSWFSKSSLQHKHKILRKWKMDNIKKLCILAVFIRGIQTFQPTFWVINYPSPNWNWWIHKLHNITLCNAPRNSSCYAGVLVRIPI